MVCQSSRNFPTYTQVRYLRALQHWTNMAAMKKADILRQREFHLHTDMLEQDQHRGTTSSFQFAEELNVYFIEEGVG